MLDIKNKSFAVTSQVEVPADGAVGVIIAQGGRSGGWSLYAKDGHAKFHYNVLGIKSFSIDATAPIPAGTTQVRMEFAYDGGGMGKGGEVTLYYDGAEVGSRPRRADPGLHLLRRRNHRRLLRIRHHRQPGLHRTHQRDSPARSNGYGSTSVRTPRTPITTSTPTRGSA